MQWKAKFVHHNNNIYIKIEKSNQQRRSNGKGKKEDNVQLLYNTRQLALVITIHSGNRPKSNSYSGFFSFFEYTSLNNNTNIGAAAGSRNLTNGRARVPLIYDLRGHHRRRCCYQWLPLPVATAARCRRHRRKNSRTPPPLFSQNGGGGSSPQLRDMVS